MSSAQLTTQERHIRLFIYRFVLSNDRCPSVNEVARQAGVSPLEAGTILRRLQDVHQAIILSPGSENLWLADPFAALPTAYPVFAEEHAWFGMCVWDALGILAICGRDGHAPTLCPVSGKEMVLQVQGGQLTKADGVVHFAVPAAEWWKDIGFT